MAKVPFTHYLHDDGEEFYSTVVEPALIAAGIPAPPEYSNAYYDLMDKVGRPFYEVTLQCVLDDQTGEVTLISASL